MNAVFALLLTGVGAGPFFAATRHQMRLQSPFNGPGAHHRRHRTIDLRQTKWGKK